MASFNGKVVHFLCNCTQAKIIDKPIRKCFMYRSVASETLTSNLIGSVVEATFMSAVLYGYHIKRTKKEDTFGKLGSKGLRRGLQARGVCSGRSYIIT